MLILFTFEDNLLSLKNSFLEILKTLFPLHKIMKNSVNKDETIIRSIRKNQTDEKTNLYSDNSLQDISKVNPKAAKLQIVLSL